MIRRRKRSHRNAVEDDLEVLPLMNLFVVLIPMLLLSAVFLEMAVIRMNLPSEDAAPAAERKESLGLSIAIEESRWLLKGRRLEARAIDRTAENAVDVLRATLAEVTVRFPDDHDVVIVSQPHTRYDDIIEVMDVSRETGHGNVSLLGSGS